MRSWVGASEEVISMRVEEIRHNLIRISFPLLKEQSLLPGGVRKGFTEVCLAYRHATDFS